MMTTTSPMVAHCSEILEEGRRVRPMDCSFSCSIVYAKTAAVDKAFHQGR